MKKTLIFAASALLLAACNGNKDLAPEQIGGEANLVEYSFKVGAETKAAISDAGAFSWAAGDEIAVWDAQNNKFDKFTADSDGASTTISGLGATDANYTKAFYPYAAAASETSVAWPDSYASAADAAKGFPMMALNESGTLNFKHLGALLKISINDLPAGVTSLVFNGVGVSGTLPVDDTDPAAPFCALGSSASSIILPTKAVAGDAVFYLPLPVGTLTGGFSIDFRITSATNKVVGTKATTSNVSIARGKLIPMKAFEPTFDWPDNSNAYDSGIAKGATKTATYPKSERETQEVFTRTTNQNKLTKGETAILDKMTYYGTCTFGGNKWYTGTWPGPDAWQDLPGDSFDDIVPANYCLCWKVNRPGTFKYYFCAYSSSLNVGKQISYRLVLRKTVDGVETAEILIDTTPDESLIKPSTEVPSSSSTYAEFEVPTEALLGIDDAATLYFYGYSKKSSSEKIQLYHFPTKWTPSVDE